MPQYVDQDQPGGINSITRNQAPRRGRLFDIDSATDQFASFAEPVRCRPATRCVGAYYLLQVFLSSVVLLIFVYISNTTI